MLSEILARRKFYFSFCPFSTLGLGFRFQEMTDFACQFDLVALQAFRRARGLSGTKPATPGAEAFEEYGKWGSDPGRAGPGNSSAPINHTPLPPTYLPSISEHPPLNLRHAIEIGARRPTDMFSVAQIGPGRVSLEAPIKAFSLPVESVLVAFPKELRAKTNFQVKPKTKSEYAEALKDQIGIDSHCSNRAESLGRWPRAQRGAPFSKFRHPSQQVRASPAPSTPESLAAIP